MVYDNWTWNAGTNTLTIISDTGEGDTEGTAYDFDDVQTYATANGLSMTTQCTIQYCIDFKIVIGDGSTITWFADTEKQVFINDVWVDYYDVGINIRDNAHFRLGYTYDETARTTGSGVALYGYATQVLGYIIYAQSADAEVELYDCQILLLC